MLYLNAGMCIMCVLGGSHGIGVPGGYEPLYVFWKLNSGSFVRTSALNYLCSPTNVLLKYMNLSQL